MKRRGKQYRKAAELVEINRLYSPSEALVLVKQAKYAKFDEAVEAHFNLGIDPRHADQQIRGTLVLPKGTGKTTRVAVIAVGDKAADAEKAGADVVGSEELIEKIQGGWFEFDVLIATPDQMAKLGKIARILGPKGLMPSPKSGTVTQDAANAVREFKSGKIEYRNDKNGIVHLIFGKMSFSAEDLFQNLDAVYEVIQRAKPSKASGVYIKSLTVTSTMGPGVPIEPMKTKWKEVA